MTESHLVKMKPAPDAPKKSMKSTGHKILMALHLFAYIAVSGLLSMLWLIGIELTGITFFWPIFAMLGWGIGISLHLLAYLMYFEKLPYLARIKKKGSFSILFVFHAPIYILANLIIVSSNLMMLSMGYGLIYFYWPLSMWGIAFGYHALGFFTWDSFLEKEQKGIRSKHSDYDAKRIKMLATTKLSNLWLLLIHVTYFIVVAILMYAYFPLLSGIPLEQEILIDGTISWATILGLHTFSYFFYYYNDTVKPVTKGLIIHISFYAASNILVLYQWIKNPISNIFFPIYSLILWGILIGFHVLIALKYGEIMKGPLKRVERMQSGLDAYDLRKEARWLLFWQWSFIAHLVMYAVGMVLIGITMALLAIDLSLLIHPAMGWMIGLAVHGSLFYIVYQNIRSFWKWTFTIHFAAYISVSVYLVILNVLIGGFLWSAIAIFGWGIGIGIHAIIAYVR